ncbi:MAG: GHKL domain-containing protein [Nitrospirae bacterium]|nr:GHKL domain-containing protein [Nitrospirota bacterium]
MRRIFFIILGFFIVITAAGILFMGARLLMVKGKIDSLTEAQKSFIKRAELRDAIHELKHGVLDRKMSGEEAIELKTKIKRIVSECYGCHHPPEIIGYVKNIEKRIALFDREIDKGDFYHRPEKVSFHADQIIPLVDDAYIKAKFLTDMRLEHLMNELSIIRKTGIISAVAGLFLFLGFSMVSLKRVSRLESEVRERERVLQDWAEQWQHTFDSIQDMVFIVNKDCRISMMNTAAKERYGEGILGRGTVEALGDIFTTACKSVCRQGLSKEVSLADKVFTLRSFQMHPDDNNGGCVLVARDITAEKEMESRVAQAEKLAALGQVIAGVAHELNNPLSSIGGFSELLIQSATDDNARGMADKINKSVNRAANIVQELLIFSRAPKLEKEPVNIKKMFSETLDLISEALNTHRINAVAVTGDEITAGLDTAQMERVLLNLLTNAIHAISDSGKGDRILLKAERFDDRLIIEVSDNGPGISQQVIHRIFEPFFTTKKVGKGTGLGLGICYNIVKAHGGDIRVKSIEGEGTTFIIELPYQEF